MLPRPVRAFSSRTKSSTQWLQRQNRDIYVKQAKTAGFLSRAAYKLLHLNRVRFAGAGSHFLSSHLCTGVQADPTR